MGCTPAFPATPASKIPTAEASVLSPCGASLLAPYGELCWLFMKPQFGLLVIPRGITAWAGPHGDGSSSLNANCEIKSPLSQFLLRCCGWGGWDWGRVFPVPVQEMWGGLLGKALKISSITKTKFCLCPDHLDHGFE